MVNISSEKLYNERALSEGRGQLVFGKTVKYFSVSAPGRKYVNHAFNYAYFCMYD